MSFCFASWPPELDHLGFRFDQRVQFSLQGKRWGACSEAESVIHVRLSA